MMPFYILFFSMFAVMLTFIAVAFRQGEKKLLSLPFVALSLIALFLTASLYRVTGSAEAFQHYRLQKIIQSLGGIEQVIRQIERRVKKNPDDARGRAILEKIKKQGRGE